VRVLLILVVIVALMALVGWIKFRNSPQESTITIEKETIQQDAKKIVDRGNEFVEDARKSIGIDEAETNGKVAESPPSSNDSADQQTNPARSEPADRPVTAPN
jgi:cytoskeletal protein RodZ